MQGNAVVDTHTAVHVRDKKHGVKYAKAPCTWLQVAPPLDPQRLTQTVQKNQAGIHTAQPSLCNKGRAR